MFNIYTMSDFEAHSAEYEEIMNFLTEEEEDSREPEAPSDSEMEQMARYYGEA